jgi:hypothetical protein
MGKPSNITFMIASTPDKVRTWNLPYVNQEFYHLTKLKKIQNSSIFNLYWIILDVIYMYVFVYRRYGRGDSLRWPRGTLYPQKLALTSPTSGGRSVGKVRWPTVKPWSHVFVYSPFNDTLSSSGNVVTNAESYSDCLRQANELCSSEYQIVPLIYEYIWRNTPRGVCDIQSLGHRQKISVVDSGASFFVYILFIVLLYYAQAHVLVITSLDLLSSRAGSAYCVYS